MARRLAKTLFLNVGNGVRVYANLAKGMAGVVKRDAGTVLHAGVNPQTGAFIRAQARLAKRVSGYAYVKAHDAGAGVVGRINRHASGRVAFNNTGPFVEGRIGRLKVRRQIK